MPLVESARIASQKMHIYAIYKEQLVLEQLARERGQIVEAGHRILQH
jgi:hypothetical protein